MFQGCKLILKKKKCIVPKLLVGWVNIVHCLSGEASPL